jgi:hypothetical protein
VLDFANSFNHKTSFDLYFDKVGEREALLNSFLEERHSNRVERLGNWYWYVLECKIDPAKVVSRELPELH